MNTASRKDLKGSEEFLQWALDLMGCSVKMKLSSGMALQEISHNLLFETLPVEKFQNHFTETRSWELFPMCFQGSPQAWALEA